MEMTFWSLPVFKKMTPLRANAADTAMAVIRAEILALFAAAFQGCIGRRGAHRMWFDGETLNAQRHEFDKIKKA